MIFLLNRAIVGRGNQNHAIDAPCERQRSATIKNDEGYLVAMGIDLLIGFKQKPEGLEPYLLEQGFRLESTQEFPGWILASTCLLFVEKKSARGVWVTYYDGVDGDDQRLWQSIAPETPIVATATVSTPMGRNWFDIAKQREIAAAIRDRYAALVFDPQVARIVYHEDQIGDDAEILKHPIEYRDWYASQWSPTSVAIFTVSDRQPSRIIERPEEWGEQWAWNLYDHGVYLRRTHKD